MKDCEFDKMRDDEVIMLYTHSEELQSLIIQKDMDLAKLVSTARSMELAKKEVTSGKTILSTSILVPLKQILYPTINDTTTTHKEERTLRNKNITHM